MLSLLIAFLSCLSGKHDMVCSKVRAGVAWLQGWVYPLVVLESAELSGSDPPLSTVSFVCPVASGLLGWSSCFQGFRSAREWLRQRTAMAMNFMYKDF